MAMIRGTLRKMSTVADNPVAYSLPIGDQAVPLNTLLGDTLRLIYTGQIICRACAQRTKKSFGEGYCFRCFSTLARCDLCIVKPELCHFAQGTCREPEWGLANCMQPHYVYLANASGLKVGITRASQIPTRWLDQGAVQALPILQVQSRHQAGLIEVILKQHISDRTNWRKMLKGEPEQHDLRNQREVLLERCQEELHNIAELSVGAPTILEEQVREFIYPVLQYPTRVTALNFDKKPVVEGTLLGVKGQYLIFDAGVLNIRKFSGYEITVT